MSDESYLFEEGSLIIKDKARGLDKEGFFSPPLIPENLSEGEKSAGAYQLVIEKNSKSSDNRTLAVNSNSKSFLMNLGLWGNFKEKPENINKIVIQDYLNHEPLIFNNTQSPMGYVAYNQEILSNAKNKLRKSNSLIENFEVPLNKTLLSKKFDFKNNCYKFK